MIASSLLVLGALAAATATISMTVSKSSAFKGLRAILEPVPFIGGLISCPYCTSHWVALAGVVVTGLRLFGVWAPVDIFLTAMAVVALNAPLAGLIYRAYSAMVDEDG